MLTRTVLLSLAIVMFAGWVDRRNWSRKRREPDEVELGRWPELQKRFGHLELKMLGLLVPGTILAGGLWYGLLYQVLIATGIRYPGSTYLVSPNPVWFAVVALLLGVSTALHLFVRPIVEWWVREEAEDWHVYLDVQRFQSRGAGDEVLRIACNVAFLAGLFLIWPPANSYTLTRPEGLEIHRWDFSVRTHPYSDIVRLEFVKKWTAPGGNEVPRPHYVVHFQDGSQWDTADIEGSFFKVQRVDTVSGAAGETVPPRQLIDFLAGKSGHTIVSESAEE